MNKTAFALLAAGCALAGCNNRADDNLAANDMMANDMAMNDMAMNGADMNAAGATTADAAFVTEAMKGNNSEVAAGQMAIAQGGSQAVKDYGQMLVTDHGAANDKLKAIAASAGIPATDELTEEAKANAAKMKDMTGPVFNAEFKRMAIADHQKDIAKYEAQAKSSDAATAAYANETLPTLRKHLEAAQKL